LDRPLAGVDHLLEGVPGTAGVLSAAAGLPRGCCRTADKYGILLAVMDGYLNRLRPHR
jgi:acetylornithine/succinyldiaminopimelate/putrescine aminotransferase